MQKIYFFVALAVVIDVTHAMSPKKDRGQEARNKERKALSIYAAQQLKKLEKDSDDYNKWNKKLSKTPPIKRNGNSKKSWNKTICKERDESPKAKQYNLHLNEFFE